MHMLIISNAFMWVQHFFANLKLPGHFANNKNVYHNFKKIICRYTSILHNENYSIFSDLKIVTFSL